MKISEKEFQAYEDAKTKGITYLLGVGVVRYISGLPKEKIFEIIRPHSELSEE
jgi:hypothetical protein